MKKTIIAIRIISAILFAIGTFTIIVSAAENTVASQTIMGGTVTLTAEKTSDTTITLTIENNFEKEVSTFGYPEIIVNGIQQELDKHLQLKNGTQRLSVPAGEKGQITYYVTDANSVEALIGKLFCMGYSKSDDEFSLEFNGDTAPVQTESGAVTTTSAESQEIGTTAILTEETETTTAAATTPAQTSNIVSTTTISDITKQFDFETAISEFTSTSHNTIKLKLNKTDAPSAAVWTNGGGANCYSSDESVVTVSDKGVVTAVGEGTAYVAIDTGRMSEVYRYDVISANSITKEDVVKIGFIVVPCILVLFLALGIYNAVTTLHFSNVSMKKKELPERRQTANTITTPTTEKQTYIVPVNGMMEAQKAEALINQWFAENPYVYNCKLKLEAESILGTHFVKHKFFVKRAVIEYCVADTPQPYQYGVAFIYKYRFFGSIGYNNAKQLADWQANNTDCEIISTHFEGRIEHSVNNGLPTAQYYNYVFFKK